MNVGVAHTTRPKIMELRTVEQEIDRVSFNVSFDEVVITLFVSGVRTKTLPVKVWDAILYEITPILPAISAVIIVASVLLLTPLLLARRSS